VNVTTKEDEKDMFTIDPVNALVIQWERQYRSRTAGPFVRPGDWHNKVHFDEDDVVPSGALIPIPSSVRKVDGAD
jgi:hypothetical protein